MKAAIYDAQFLSGVGIAAVLENHPESYQIKLLDTDQQLKLQLEREQPDLLVLEYLGPHTVSTEVIRQIRKEFPKMKVLIISEDDDTIEIKRRMALGIHGFLTKKCSPDEISLTINTINQGGRFYCQKIIDIMSSQDHAASVELSPREQQVVHMLGKGMTSSSMAEHLNLSIHTINSHRKNILKKLGFKSPAELIAYAIKQAD